MFVLKLFDNILLFIYIIIAILKYIRLNSSSPRFHLGIDFGSEFIKASLYDSDKSIPIMVENLQSKTKFNNILSILEEERKYGHEAILKQYKKPGKCYSYLSDFINNYELILNGTNINDKNLDDIYFPNIFNRYDIFKINENLLFKFTYEYKNFELSLEGFIAMQLKFLLDMAYNTIKNLYVTSNEYNNNSKYFLSKIGFTVISVPLHYNIVQRRILYVASKLANINLGGFINDNDAAILNYMEEKFKYVNTKTNKYSKFVSVINIGSTNNQINLYKLTKSTINKKVILKVNYIIGENLSYIFGGRFMNKVLYNYFKSKFLKNQYIDNIFVLKVLSSIIKYKEILSSNKETEFKINELKGIFTRKEFEDIIISNLNKVKLLIESMLLKVILNYREINSMPDCNELLKNFMIDFELIGGASRTPLIKEVIKAIFSDDNNHTKIDSNMKDIYYCIKNNKQLFYDSISIGTHINSDDSIAIGSSKFAYYINKSIEYNNNKLYSIVDINNSLYKDSDLRLVIDIIDLEYFDLNKKSYNKYILNDYKLFSNESTLNNKALTIYHQIDKFNLSIYNDVAIIVKEISSKYGKEYIYQTFIISNILSSIAKYNIDKNFNECFLKLELGLNFFSEVIIKEHSYSCSNLMILDFDVNIKVLNNTKSENENIFDKIKFVWKQYNESIKIKKLSGIDISKIINDLISSKYNNTSTDNIYKDILYDNNNTQINTIYNNFKSRYNFTDFELNQLNKTIYLLEEVSSIQKNNKNFSINIEKTNNYIENYYSENLYNKDLETLNKLDELDNTRENKNILRNNLETLIYEIKEDLNLLNDDAKEFDNHIKILSFKFKNIYNWYNDDGLIANKTDLETKYNELSSIYKPLKDKKLTLNELNLYYDKKYAMINNIKKKSIKQNNNKPWIRHYIDRDLNPLIKEFEFNIKLKFNTVIKKINDINFDNSDLENLNKIYRNLLDDFKNIYNTKDAYIGNIYDNIINIPEPTKPNIFSNIYIRELLMLEYSKKEDIEPFHLINFINYN